MRETILKGVIVVLSTFILILTIYLVFFRKWNGDSKEGEIDKKVRDKEFDEESSMIKITMPEDWEFSSTRRSSEGMVKSEINDIRIKTDIGVSIYIHLNDYPDPDAPYQMENTGLASECYDRSMFEEIAEIFGEPVFIVKEEYELSVADPSLLYSYADHYFCPEVCRNDPNKLSYNFALGDVEDVLIQLNYEDANLSDEALKMVSNALSSIETK